MFLIFGKNVFVEIVKSSKQLPATIEQLQKFILIGSEKLKAHKAKIRAIDKVNESFAAKEAALSDAQDLADALLEAEKKLGEMLKEIEPKYSMSSIKGTNRPHRDTTLPPTITKKESHRAQTLASNPDIVERIKEQAKKQKRIPTLEEAYQEIKKEEKARVEIQKRSEAIEKGKGLKEDTVFVRAIENLTLKESSVDLIVTDPPYADENLKHYELLAKLGVKSLKAGRFLCCYVGKLRLPQVIDLILPHLEYIWVLSIFHPYSKEKHLGPPYQFAENWRPVLIFKKAGKPPVCKFQQDVVRAEREKEFHDWQQDLKTPLQLIESYTEPGELVIDPFCGGGTTLVAAKQLGRKWLGFDRSEESVAISKQRIHDN